MCVPFFFQIIITIVLTILIIGTIVGNTLVCTAVGIVKRLRTPSNLLIVSLAVADLLVSLLVMPFALKYELDMAWTLNDVLCDLWTSLDVLLCTASILNLCMISVDRYFVITRPLQYAMKRTPRRMGCMIAVVWIVSGLISIPPIFGWKDKRIATECFISQKLGYQIYATLFAFYAPLTVMIVVYYRIWLVSTRIKKADPRSKIGSFDRGTEMHQVGHGRPSNDSGDSHMLPNGTLRDTNSLTVPGSGDEDAGSDLLSRRGNSLKRRRFTIRSLLPRSSHKGTYHRERKATKTLGIIMGGFTLCWLPFFILALVRPFLDTPNWLFSLLNWLGYFNSFLNPVIYARFNREFRTPFKEILCFRCRGINMRMRSESYVEQYGRDSLRPAETMVRYHSQGHTTVQMGNGSANNGETKI